METKTLEEISRSLKAIEYHLSELCEREIVYPDTEFWREYSDVKMWIFNKYRITISEGLYMDWHNEHHKDKRINHETLIVYAYERREEIERIMIELDIKR